MPSYIFKSKEELYFSWWLDELKKHNIVKAWAYESETHRLVPNIMKVEYKISKLKKKIVSKETQQVNDSFTQNNQFRIENQEMFYHNVLGIKVTDNEKTLKQVKQDESIFLRGITYTPDFKIVWNRNHPLVAYTPNLNSIFRLLNGNYIRNKGSIPSVEVLGINTFYYENNFGLICQDIFNIDALQDEAITDKDQSLKRYYATNSWSDSLSIRYLLNNRQFFQQTKSNPSTYKEIINLTSFQLAGIRDSFIKQKKVRVHVEFLRNRNPLCSNVDVKGSFAGANNISAVTFPLKQKLLFCEENIYVEKVIPVQGKKSLFNATFFPERYFYTDEGNALRKIKINGAYVTLKDSGLCKTFSEFTKERWDLINATKEKKSKKD